MAMMKKTDHAKGWQGRGEKGTHTAGGNVQ